MFYFSVWAFVLVVCGVYGEDLQQAETAVPGINPYYPNRNPLIPGYNPNYKPNNNQVPILSYSSNQGDDGSYSFSFSTADGKQAQETGYLKDAYVNNVGETQATQVKEGSYSYVSPEGAPIAQTYVADERGFRPGPVQFSTDGRGVAPTFLPNGPRGSPLNNRYNLYDPFNRNNYLGQFNNFKPYDPRYPYDSRRHYDPRYQYDPRYPNNQRYNPYNPYNARLYRNVLNKEDKKVETA